MRLSSDLPVKEPDGSCNGRLKLRRGYCIKPEGWGVPGATKGRCRWHGGKSLRGAEHPMAKHLRYSKYLPEALLARYQEARDDPQLLELRDEIALVDSRLIQLIDPALTGWIPSPPALPPVLRRSDASRLLPPWSTIASSAIMIWSSPERPASAPVTSTPLMTSSASPRRPYTHCSRPYCCGDGS